MCAYILHILCFFCIIIYPPSSSTLSLFWHWKQRILLEIVSKTFWSGRLGKMILSMIYFAVSFSATPINKHQKPPKWDASPYTLCPLCSWPLQHFLLKEIVAGNYIIALAFIFILPEDIFWQWFKKQINIFLNSVLWRVMLTSDWDEVLLGTQSFPIQLWSFISNQTCGRPAFPVLGVCRAELQSAYCQNAQVSSTIPFIYIFSELAWAVNSHAQLTILKTRSLSSPLLCL